MPKAQESSNTFVYIVLGLIVASIIGLAIIRTRPKPAPPGADALAQCVKDSGSKFYGAYWCPHCAEQKAMFGSAVSKLPYIECAQGNGQTKECDDAGVHNYPTWFNGKGEKQEGVMSFKQLADFTGCPFNP